MKTTLDYKKNFLCILAEAEIQMGRVAPSR